MGECPGRWCARSRAPSAPARAVLALRLAVRRPAAETCQAYRPPAWLERSPPGTAPAGLRVHPCRARCDIDHVRPWLHGPTDKANLMCRAVTTTGSNRSLAGRS